MSLKLQGQKKRADFYFVDPAEIKVRSDLRGRWIPPDDRQIINLAISMHVYGQIQSCEVRVMDIAGVKNVAVLNSGFTRCAAARLLREGFTIPEDWADIELTKEDAEAKVKVIAPGDTIHNPDFLLKVTHVNCNDQQAFQRNLIENLERKDTSAIDNAHNQEKLRRDYGYSDADISRLYHYTNQGRVARLKRLLQLPDDIQLMVHTGNLPTVAALDLLDRPSKEWGEIIAKSTKDDGKVSGTAVRSSARRCVITRSPTSRTPMICSELSPTVPPKRKGRRSRSPARWPSCGSSSNSGSPARSRNGTWTRRSPSSSRRGRATCWASVPKRRSTTP